MKKNLLFRFFQNQNIVRISLQGNIFSNIYGKISGFDEFMNIVLENAFEIDPSGKKILLGQVMIKGDCIAIVSMQGQI